MGIAGEGSLRASENFGHKEPPLSPPPPTHKADFWEVLRNPLAVQAVKPATAHADSNTCASLPQSGVLQEKSPHALGVKGSPAAKYHGHIGTSLGVKI